MADYRQANYIPLASPLLLDHLRAKFVNLKYAIPTSGTFQVTDAFESNLPGIAWQVYQEVDLWWVLALYNDIVDPISDVSSGLQLLIPDKAKVLALLESPNIYDTSQLAEVLL